MAYQIGFTGSAPDVLGVTDFRDPFYGRLMARLAAGIARAQSLYGGQIVVHGDLERGGGMSWAKAAFAVRAQDRHGLRFIAHVPCNGHTADWDDNDIERYDDLLDRSDEVRLYAPQCSVYAEQKRDQALVRAVHQLIALHDQQTPDETSENIEFARNLGIKVTIFEPRQFHHDPPAIQEDTHD